MNSGIKIVHRTEVEFKKNSLFWSELLGKVDKIKTLQKYKNDSMIKGAFTNQWHYPEEIKGLNLPTEEFENKIFKSKYVGSLYELITLMTREDEEEMAKKLYDNALIAVAFKNEFRYFGFDAETSSIWYYHGAASYYFRSYRVWSRLNPNRNLTFDLKRGFSRYFYGGNFKTGWNKLFYDRVVDVCKNYFRIW